MKEKFFFVLVIVALIMGPALAAGINVVDATGFGTLEATLSSTSSAGIFGSAISVNASVYLNNGVYTYVYALSDQGTGTTFFGKSGISQFTIEAPDFDPTLSWGAVGDLPTGTDLNVTFVGGLLTFQFGPALPSGNDWFTVYAQSTMAPLQYTFSGVAFGPTGEGVTLGADPPGEEHLYVAEAPSFLFLGLGLLSFVGMGFFRQKIS